MSLETLFFTPPNSPKTPSPSPEEKGILGKVWDGTKWTIRSLAWGATRPVAWAFNPIGDGLGTGVVGGAKKEIEQWMQPEGPLATQFKQTLEQALLRQPPEELLTLRDTIKKVLADSHAITQKDIETLYSCLLFFSKENWKPLQQLAPDLNKEAIEMFQGMLDFLFPYATSTEDPEETLKSFKEINLNTQAGHSVFEIIHAVINEIISRNQGTLLQAMKFLQQALLSEQQGVLSQALEILKTKCIDPDKGLIKQAVDQLTQLLEKKDGPLDLLSIKLTTGEQSLIAQAVELLKAKLLGKGGVVEELGKQFNHPENGIITQALEMAKVKLDEALKESLALLKTELTSEHGLLAKLQNQVSGKEGSILSKAIQLLNDSLFQEGEGVIPKLRQELTSENKGLLAEALKILASKLNDEKEGILIQSIDLLKRKLNSEDGLLEDAIRLLELKLNGKNGVIENLTHRLLNENDGALVQALDLLQKKLNDEKEGILAQAINLLQKRLQAEDGPLSSLEKKLTDPEKGLLSQAIQNMQQALEKKGGPLDLLDQRLQKTVADALDILQKKTLDPQDGLVATTLRLLNQHLHEEKGVLDTLNKCLNDPKEGLIAKAFEILNQKLLEENGPLDILKKKLLDEKQGILVQAIELLNLKLLEQNGPLDHLQKKLLDENGILDQALKLLETRLNDQDRGILVQARNYLSKELVDEKDGILAKAIDVLNRKLKEKGGPLDTLEVRLTHEDTGILSRAIQVLQNQLMAKGGIIDQLEERLTGLATRTGEILQQTISNTVNPLLDRVEGVPKKMVQNLTNLVSSPDSPSQEGEGTISQFLNYGNTILKNLLDKGGQALSQQALSSFTSILSLGLKQALKKMDATDAFVGPRQVLMEIIQSLENPQTLSHDPDAFDASGRALTPWETLYNRIKRAAETLNSVKIYINGFRIPHVGQISEVESRVEAAFLDNTNALRDALEPLAPPPPENQDWKTLARKEKDKLIENTTQFLTLKHIYEEVCHLKPIDDQFYLRLLKQSKTKGSHSQEELKNLFFNELVKHKVGIFTRLWARFQYNVLFGFFVKRYVARASTIYFNEIFKFIDLHKAENFDTLRNQLTKNFTRYLVILGGAYRKVAASQEDGLLEEMLKRELEKPEANLKFDTKELYKEFAQEVISKAAGSRIMAWIIRKTIGDPEIMVRQIVDKATSALQDESGYTHALNSVICEQLEEIWRMLQEAQARRKNGSVVDSDANLSEIKKDELAALVKNLFEILSKSKCNTLDELRDLVQGKLLSANINKAIDDLFIEEIIEKVTNILAVTIQSLIKEDQLQKLTYKFASLVNRSFEVGEPYSLEERKNKERQIAKLCGQILQTSVETAIEEKFDFTGRKQQSESNRYIQELHQRSQEFFKASEQDFAILLDPDVDFSSNAAKIKINKIVDQTLAYELECSADCFQAKSSKMNSDNKDEITQRYLGIAQQSKPLVEAVVHMKQHAKILESLKGTVPKLNNIKKIISCIPLILFRLNGATDNDFIHSGNQLQILEEHLKELRQFGQLTSCVVEQISQEKTTLAHAIVEIQKATRVRTFCTTLAASTSPLAQIVNQKKHELLTASTGTSDLKNKIAKLQQDIRLHFDPAVFLQLSSQLKHIENAKDVEEIDMAYREFFNLASQALTQANVLFDQARNRYWIAHSQINRTIDTSQLLDPQVEEKERKEIRTAVDQAVQHLQTLKDWEQEHIKEIPYINFSLLDTKGLQDWATGLVYHRVKERMDGLMKLLRREETYRYGILHHLFLIPYIQYLRS